MSKLVIIATIQVQPGSRDRAIKILLDHRMRCLRDEPGTLQFDVLVPSDKPLGPGAPIPDQNPTPSCFTRRMQTLPHLGSIGMAPVSSRPERKLGQSSLG